MSKKIRFTRHEDEQLFWVLDTVIKTDKRLTFSELSQMTGVYIGGGGEDKIIARIVDDGYLAKSDEGTNPTYGITQPGYKAHASLLALSGAETKGRRSNLILFWAAIVAAVFSVIAVYLEACTKTQQSPKSGLIQEQIGGQIKPPIQSASTYLTCVGIDNTSAPAQ